jgi:hypothetical protein
MSEQAVASPSKSTRVIDVDPKSIYVAPGRKRKPLNLTDERDLAIVENVRMIGILNPVSVRKTPNGSKPFELVCGLKRLSIAKYLELSTVPVHVIEASDKEMKFIEFAENTMRREMDHHEYERQLKVLLKEMETIYGPDPENSKGGKARAAKATRDPDTKQFTTESRSEPEPEEPALCAAHNAGPEPQPARTYQSILSDITGRSQGTVSKDIKIAEAFTEEELQVLQFREVSHTDMLSVAKLEPASCRNEAIGHIAMGEPAPRAIELATAKLKADQEAAKTPKPPKEEELSDADWLVGYYHAVRSQLQNPAGFDRDALFYRHDRVNRQVHKGDARDELKKALDAGYSPFVRLAYNSLYVEHPDHWFICAECGGRNVDLPQCGHCSGFGYRLKFQDRKRR